MMLLVRLFTWTLIIVSIFWLGALAHFVQAIPTAPVGETVTTDAIVVLTGGEHRLEYGFELLEKKKAKKMLITGVGAGATVNELIAEHAPREEIRRLADSIALDHAASNTLGNAQETALWMQREGFRSMRMVTSNYHVPRSMIEFRHAMPDIIIIADPVIPETFQHDHWWEDVRSRTLVFSEFHKYLATWVRQLVN